MFATIILSTFATSSTVRLSEFFRSFTLTMRAKEPIVPLVSPTMPTRSPTTTDFGPSSRAFMAVTMTPSSVMHVVLPRSTVVTNASMASECEGRSLLLGRVVRLGRILTSDSSNFRPINKVSTRSGWTRAQENRAESLWSSRCFRFRRRARPSQ
jgi:hypothetical protein